MSRGRNGGYKNRTLAWYLDSKIFDGTAQQEQENTNKRKNSFDSESSLNSNGRQPGNESEERKRRADKVRGNRQRSQNSFTGNQRNDPVLNDINGQQQTDSIQINGGRNNDSLSNSPEQQSNVVLQQQLLALSAQTAVQKTIVTTIQNLMAIFMNIVEQEDGANSIPSCTETILR